MKLYRIETKGMGSYWVVASDPTAAENKLKEAFNKWDYGYYTKRESVSIHVIAEQINLEEKSSIGILDKYLLI